MKDFFVFLLETIKIVILAIIIVFPIRYFIFQPFFVQGISMEPSFFNGDYLIADEITYRFRDPQRGEVVIFKYPQSPTQRYIKRIIGLPGETIIIENGQISIIDENKKFILDESGYLPDNYTGGAIKALLSEDEYFVLGDNRAFSSDSRRWGALSKEFIVGKVYLRAWPFTALAKIEAPVY
ncbi:MAG: signal peptidase I [Candidatus Nealsonbacteria bacterium]